MALQPDVLPQSDGRGESKLHVAKASRALKGEIKNKSLIYFLENRRRIEDALVLHSRNFQIFVLDGELVPDYVTES